MSSLFGVYTTNFVEALPLFSPSVFELPHAANKPKINTKDVTKLNVFFNEFAPYVEYTFILSWLKILKIL